MTTETTKFPGHLAEFTLPIVGMHCASCTSRVEQFVGQIEGVAGVTTNLVAQIATTRYYPSETDVAAIVQAVCKSGYRVPVTNTVLRIQGMHCASCVGRVEHSLSRVPGVLGATVNLVSAEARVRHVQGPLNSSDLKAAVRDSGYYVTEAVQDGVVAEQDQGPGATIRHRELTLVRNQAVFALSIGAILLWGTAEYLPWLREWAPEFLKNPYIMLVLATPVQLWAGWRFYKGAWTTARHLSADMNTLIAVGTSVAYFYSAVLTIWPRAVTVGTGGVTYYFDTAAFIIGLILLGRYLEERAKERTLGAITRLIGLQVKAAQVEREGRVLEVAIEDVLVGDIVLVRPGERVPVDGEVVEGASAVDESLITGEGIPVDRGVGDVVIGTTLNTTGSLRVRTDRVGGDTVLAQIIRMVERAQMSKAPVQKLADWVAARFVPVVILIALATFGAWFVIGPEPALNHALASFVAVMVIACPCALGLATPTAIMVGTGKGADYGVLIRGGEALETASKIDTLVMDKTGTITVGAPELTDVVPLNGMGELGLLGLVAAAEGDSEHPIANAVLRGAEDRDIVLVRASTFRSVTGGGVHATVDGRKVLVGTAAFLADEGVDVEGAAAHVDELAGRGRTPICAALDGQLAGVLAVADTVKTESRAAIAQVRSLGLQVLMLTGDKRLTAEAIAREVGIDEVRSEVRPEDKASIVQDLQTAGHSVAMAGDGINDAPALAQADLGIAMGNGTDIALQASDITLVGGNLRGVVVAIDLSRRTMRTIKQNLMWAFGYNTLLIPLAAGVLFPALGLQLSPILCAAAMALSSLSVVANSLHLRRYQYDTSDL